MRFVIILSVLFVTALAGLCREAELVSWSGDWRYFDHRNPPPGWTEPGYDDFFWQTGKAPLGYGHEYPHVTAYFRKHFRVADPGQFQGLRLELKCWNGAVVYLNGEEIARPGMSAGAVTQDTYASGAGEEIYEGELDAALLREGENVLAVEVHRFNEMSPGLSMDGAFWGRMQDPQVIDVEIRPEAAYFLLDVPYRVATYEFATGTWRPVIVVQELIGHAKQLTVSEDGIFVASDTRVAHWDPVEGTWESFDEELWEPPTRPYPSPFGGILVSRQGMVYGESKLDLLARLTNPVVHAAFAEGNAVVIATNDEIIAYGRDFREAGRLELERSPVAMTIHGGQLLLFEPGDSGEAGLRVKAVGLDSLGLLGIEADPAVSQSGAESAFVSGDVVHMIDIARNRLNRFSLTERRYLEPVGLQPGPVAAAHLPSAGQMFYTTVSRDLWRLDLANGTETRVAAGTVDPATLAVSGDGVGAWHHPAEGTVPDHELKSHRILQAYSANGSRLAGEVQTSVPSPPELSGCPGRLFYVSGGVYSVEVKAPGGLGQAFPVAVDGLPMAFQEGGDPEGRKAVTTYGVVMDVESGLVLGQLPKYREHDPFSQEVFGTVSAVWIGNDVVGIGPADGGTRVRRYSALGGNLMNTVRLQGEPLHVVRHGEGLAVITRYREVPRIQFLDGALNVLWSEPGLPVPPEQLESADRTADSVTLRWAEPMGSADAYLLEYRTSGENGWTAWPVELPGSVSQAVLGGLPESETHVFRLRSKNELGVSAWSGELSVLAAAYLGGPYDLKVLSGTSTSVTLVWEDRMTDESGFRLLWGEQRGALQSTMLPAGTRQHRVEGLMPSTAYTFWVEGVTGSVSGSVSAERSEPVNAITLTRDDAPPEGNISLTAIEATSDAFFIQWADPSLSEEGYILEVGRSQATMAEVARVENGVVEWTVEGLEPATRYFVRITAYNAFGTGASRNFELLTSAVSEGFWRGSMVERGGILHFGFLDPGRIERFDMASGTWLEPWTAPSSVLQMWADDRGVLALLEGQLIEWNDAGESRVLFSGPPQGGGHLFTIRDRIHLGGASVLDRSSGQVLLHQPAEFPQAFGVSVDPVSRRAYGVRESGRLVRMEFDDDGDFIGSVNEESLYGHRTARQSYTLPGGERVSSNAGPVFRAADWALEASLGGSFQDLAFVDGRYVLLRGEDVVLLDAHFAEAGRLALGKEMSRIAVLNETVYCFRESQRRVTGIEVETVSLDDMKPPVPAAPLYGQGNVFVPDASFSDQSGVVWMGAYEQRQFFRWSVPENAYVDPRPLLRVPVAAAYSPDLDRVYIGYNDGVSVIDAADALGSEQVFTLPMRAPLHLVAAADGRMLAVTDGLALMYGEDSMLLDAADCPSLSKGAVWSPFNNRALILSSGRSGVFRPVTAEGHFGPEGGLPSDLAPPLVPRPSSGFVVSGSGTTMNAPVSSGYTAGSRLANSFSAGLWLGAELVTLRRSNPDETQIQRWTAGGQSLGARTVPGEPNSVLVADGKLIVATVMEGAPWIRHLSLQTLEDEFVSPRRPAPPQQFEVTLRNDTSVGLAWTDTNAGEAGFEIEYREKTAPGLWMSGGTLGPDSTQAEASGLAPGTAYVFRVVAFSDIFRSEPSLEVEASTLASSNLPGGEPYGLRAVQVFAGRVVLQWDDRSTKESGFRVFRKRASPPGGAEIVVGMTGADVALFTDASVESGTAYDYRVQAFNAAGSGDLSAPLRVTTRTSDILGEEHRPHGFLDAGIGVDFITLQWTDVSTHEEGFILERNDGDGVFREIALLPFDSIEYTDTGLEPGKLYEYRLEPYNALGRSGFYADRFVRTLRLGGEFTGLEVQRGTVMYFAMTEPDTLQRFDLALGEWLSPVASEGLIVGLWADADAVFVATQAGIWRLEEGDERLVFVRLPGNPPSSVFTAGRHLYTRTDTRTYAAVDKNTGADRGSISLPVVGGSEALCPVPTDPGHRVAGALDGAFHVLRFGTAASPADVQIAEGIGRFDLKSVASADGRYVAVSGGLAYRLDPLAVVACFGSGWTELDYWGERPVKIQGDNIVVYQGMESGREMARADIPRNIPAISVQGDEAILFQEYAGVESGFLTHTIDLNALQFPVAEAPVIRGDSEILWDFGPFVGQRSVVVEGIVHFLMPGHSALARYALEQREFLESLPLLGEPVGIAAAPGEGNILVWYRDGSMNLLEASGAAPRERSFTSAVYPAFVKFDEHEIVVRGVRPGGTTVHLAYDRDGKFLQLRRLPYSWEPPLDAVWDPAGKWYVTPEGKVISTADGNVILDLPGVLPGQGTPTTAVVDGHLVAARSVPNKLSELTRFDDQLRMTHRVTVPGSGAALHPLPDGRVVVITLNEAGNRGEQFARIFLRGPELEPVSESVRGILPSIVRQPWSRPADVGGEALFRVEAASGTELSYQWWKGWEEIPGATSPELKLSGLTPEDSGVFRVEVSNLDGSIFSRFAELTVGVPRPWFTPGNLLAVRGDRLMEIGLNGEVVQSVQVPLPFRSIFNPPPPPRIATLLVDRFHGMHMLQTPHGGSGSYYLTSYDPRNGQWRFVESVTPRVGGFRDSGFALRGDEIIGPGTAFRYLEGTLTEFAVDPGVLSGATVFNGADGRIYSLRAGVITERSLESWEAIQQFDIGAVSPMTADADSNFFMVHGDGSQLIGRYRRVEEDWVSLNPGGVRLTNVSASMDGMLTAGSASGDIVWTDTELSLPRSTGNLPGTGGVYVYWPSDHEPTAIELSIEAGPLERNAIDGYYRQSVTVTGPAHSNFHHFELVVSGLADPVRIVNFDPRAAGPEIGLPYAGPGVEGPGRTVVDLIFESPDAATLAGVSYSLRWLDPNYNLPEPQIAEGPDGRVFATFPTIAGWLYHVERTKDFVNWQQATEPLPAAANHMTWELPRGADLAVFRAVGIPP